MGTLDGTEVVESFGLPYFRELSTFGALSDEMVIDLLTHGTISDLKQGEYITRIDQAADDFQVVLSGKVAYYKHCEDHAVLTRYFCKGEQIGFDLMIGLIRHEGTDVAVENSLILNISSAQFHNLHLDHPAEFGVLMLNLARELSREIAMLEDVIGRSTGWLGDH